MLKIGLIRVTWDVQHEDLSKSTLERPRRLDKVTQTSEAILLCAAWSVSRKHVGDVELWAPTIDVSDTKAVRTTFQKTRKLWHFTLKCCGYAHTDTVPTKKEKKKRRDRNDKKKNNSVDARTTKHLTQLGTHFMCTIIAQHSRISFEEPKTRITQCTCPQASVQWKKKKLRFMSICMPRWTTKIK